MIQRRFGQIITKIVLKCDMKCSTNAQRMLNELAQADECLEREKDANINRIALFTLPKC